ncbi:MAG TPA: hypothetical protein ENJ89_04840, partial [Caldithrix abyssi]|nr:hypothetical protein [Caldithrix abyssi]
MKIFKEIKYLIALSRPLNVLITFLSVWIAGVIAGGVQLSAPLLMAALSASLIGAAANMVNDIYDVEIDRINKPHRPLPSGKVRVGQAWTYYLLLNLIGLLIAVSLGFPLLVVALLVMALLFWYGKSLKRTVLWGNLTVSLCTALAFIYGAMAINDWRQGIFPALFAFFFHWGREVLKDLQDVRGDLAQGAVTFAGRFGVRKTILLINLIFLFLIILTIVPYIVHLYNKMYLWVVVFGVDAVVLFAALLLWLKNDGKTLGRLSHLLKLDMLIGLLALY